MTTPLALKIKFYYDHVLSSVYAEGPSSIHKQLTQDMVNRFIVPENIAIDAKIIDLGCGPGYFLDEMRQLGYTNLQGITLSIEDYEACQKNGHAVIKSDMNFLNNRDESVDMLFSRHSLEHSPFPYITLLEYNRVLKPNGLLYIEVPAPDCDKEHESNKNHYSILGKKMWLSLLQRSGFDIEWHEYEYPVTFDDGNTVLKETCYVFVCRRKRSADIK